MTAVCQRECQSHVGGSIYAPLAPNQAVPWRFVLIHNSFFDTTEKEGEIHTRLAVQAGRNGVSNVVGHAYSKGLFVWISGLNKLNYDLVLEYWIRFDVGGFS